MLKKANTNVKLNHHMERLAEHWGLKSTAGIDAHLADKPKTATEGIEGMTPNTRLRNNSKHKIKSDY